MIYLACFAVSGFFAYLANRTDKRRMFLLFSFISILIPVLLAGFRAYSIGIDVEKLRPAPKRLSAGKSDEEFFCAWTATEATVKRRGGSIAAILHKEIEIDPFCRVYENVLPGYYVAVSTTYDADIRIENIGEERC